MHRQGMMTVMAGRSGKRCSDRRWLHPAGFAAWCCAAAIAFAVCLPCRADITTTGSIYDVSGTYRVGDTADGTMLIDAGSQLSRTYGYIGYSNGATGTAVVVGTGSKWTSTSNFFLGYSGTGSLIVQDGGQVSSSFSHIGSNSGSSGAVMVSGTGSTWTPGGLYVGESGAGSLTVQDGGQVSSSYSCLGYNSGSSGTVMVSGTGSTWTVSGLHVGESGAGSLTVQDGGRVHAGTLYASLSDLHGNGIITVDSGGVLDADIVFDTTNGLSKTFAFGSSGSLNISFISMSVLGAGHKTTGTLRIADGCSVTSPDGYLGHSSGSSGAAAVSGAGSIWTCTAGLYIGRHGMGSLTVEDGGRVSTGALYASLSDLHGNGTITASGGVLDDDVVFDAANGPSQTFTFGLGGSLNISFSPTRVLGAGYKTVGSLRIADGRNITSSVGRLGYHFGSSGTAVVSGAGSRWTSTGDFYVGNYGAGSLIVQDGGQVTGSYSYLGLHPGSSGTAVLSGIGSTWTSTYEFNVGYSGTGTLTIQEGSQVSNSHGHIGFYSGSDGAAVVKGTGARWTNAYTLWVGRYGTGSLAVQDGGQVSNSSGYVGGDSGSGGIVVVSGTGSKWTNMSSLHVGYYGTGSLTVQNDGHVISYNSYLGYYSGSSGTAVVSGAGSMRTTDNLVVGHYGKGSLTIQDGGQVSSTVGYIGRYSGSSGMAVVSGSGSTWTSTGSLSVGSSGTGSLTVQDGGQVSNLASYIGYYSGSSGMAVVSGTGAMWRSTGDFYVGSAGTGSLTVRDGGQVSNFSSYIGGVVDVSGMGATWASTGVFSVSGTGTASLTVREGGQVISGSHSYLGHDSGSSGTAIVGGTGAIWTTSGMLYIGHDGTGSLTVRSGGQVSGSLDSYIGYEWGSSGTAVVRGPGSTWTTSGILRVGYRGIGWLTIADGGKATARSVFINLQSVTNLRVNGDDMVVLGSDTTAGSITNYGKVNLYADAFLAGGTYRPITEYAGRAITWSGSGSYNATGGAWDPAAKTFIVKPAVQVAGGVVAAVTTGQRLLVTDAASGKRAGVSFPAVPAVPAGTTFRANAMGSAELSALALASGEYILAAWDFATNFTGPAMLAFDVGIVPRPTVPAGGAAGAGESVATDGLTGGLKTYRLAGSSWALLPAGDFIYAQTGIASFTTGVFGRFAITAVSATGDADRDGRVDDDDLSLLLSNWNQPAGWTAGNFSGDQTVDDDDLSLLLSNWTGGPAPAVPEPATLAILALGVVGMLRRRPRASSGNR